MRIEMLKFKYVCAFIFCLLLNIQILHSKSSFDFEMWGDALTLAPFGVLIATLSMRDYEGAIQLTLGSLTTQGIIEFSKRWFVAAHEAGYDVNIAKRPCCNSYDGFPSGHAGGAFSAAAFVYYRYGWKPALPIIGLGILTAASRVYANKHNILQVAVGGAIAWGVAYLFNLTSKYHNKIRENRFLVFPNIDYGGGGIFYSLQVYIRW